VVLRDAQGKVLKFVGTTTDIDDQKRTEEALHQAQADLTRINRVIIVGELTASLPHEPTNRSVARSPTQTSAGESSGTRNLISMKCARLPPEL
jgi:C4-dicarboxylate-specific signal transduction histidine kinase